ncbi:hypothetical protein ACS0TY_015849 [Phlomoides rotata]
MASGHGEWWNANVIDAENIKITIGGAPNISDAYTINGCPRDTHAHQRIKSGVRKYMSSMHNQRCARQSAILHDSEP